MIVGSASACRDRSRFVATVVSFGVAIVSTCVVLGPSDHPAGGSSAWAIFVAVAAMFAVLGFGTVFLRSGSHARGDRRREIVAWLVALVALPFATIGVLLVLFSIAVGTLNLDGF